MNKKIKMALSSIFIIGLLFIASSFIRYCLLDVYRLKKDALIHNDSIYISDSELNKKIIRSQLEIVPEKEIGKTDDSNFLGFKTMIYKIKGMDEEKVVWVKGLMFDGVYSIKSNQDH